MNVAKLPILSLIPLAERMNISANPGSPSEVGDVFRPVNQGQVDMSRDGLFLACLVSAMFAIGCGGPPAVPSISFTPGSMATESFTQYDVNKDGKLDATELKKCPSLSESFVLIDTNDDKGIDVAELTARFTAYRDGGTSLRDVTPRVVRGNRPVTGVTVTLEPEKFMGGSIQPATGVSGSTGDVVLNAPGQPYPGAQVGCYRVIVSQKDGSGKELVPAKYNSASTIGVEVGPDNRINLVIDLDR